MNRPTSITVFGVLNLVLGGIGLLGLAMSGVMMVAMSGNPEFDMFPGTNQQPLLRAWSYASIPLGALAQVALITAGIGLLRLRPWGRKLAVYYSMYAIVMSMFALVIQVMFVLPELLPQLREQMQGVPPAVVYFSAGVGGTCSGLFQFLHPGLMWYYMTRPHVIAAFEGRWQPAAPAREDLTAQWQAAVAQQAPATADNPYAAPQTAPAVYGATLVPDLPASESAMDRIVPAKNGAALVSYYTGLFSLFPCFGLALSVVAVYYGLRGLANYRANPAVHGRIHAYVGLCCGLIFGLFNSLLAVLMIVGIVGAVLAKQ